MLKKTFIASAICLASIASVAQADDAHEMREMSMKKIGGSMGAMGAIAKGAKPYDADVVKTSLTTISEQIKMFPDYFGEGTEHADGEASPAIWENMDDFKAKAAALETVADNLLAELPADQAGVGAAMGQLGKTCGACHSAYRLKK